VQNLNANLDKLHTTDLGAARIKRNLDLQVDKVCFVVQGIRETGGHYHWPGKEMVCVWKRRGYHHKRSKRYDHNGASGATRSRKDKMDGQNH